MTRAIASLLAVLAPGAALAFSSAHAAPPPLVDGDCSEYAALGVKPLAMSPDVSLFAYQDEHYVWLCYSYPPGSFGTLDLKFWAPSSAAPYNLHVSAQLGEWLADQPETAPKNPESDRWWNNKGWTANPVWINGMDRTDGRASYRFKNAPARELQLSKARFRYGEWRFRFNIRGIKNAAGETYDIDYPQGAAAFAMDVRSPR